MDTRILVKESTPREAAALLTELEHGMEEAYRTGYDRATWREDIRALARELNDVYASAMEETIAAGMRTPGESVQQFAARAEAEAKEGEPQIGTPEYAAPLEQAHALEDRQAQAERDADGTPFKEWAPQEQADFWRETGFAHERDHELEPG